MQVIQAIFGIIGVAFMALGGLLMTRRCRPLIERFDAAAHEHGCASEHQACYEVALFCLEAAFLFALVAFVASYAGSALAVGIAMVVLIAGLVAGAFSLRRRVDMKDSK